MSPGLSLTGYQYSFSARIGAKLRVHYSDVIMGMMASQITRLTTVYSTVYSGTDQRKHQSSVSPVFVRGIHRWPLNSPHKWPVTRKMFPFYDVIMGNWNHLRRVTRATAWCKFVWIWNANFLHTLLNMSGLIYKCDKNMFSSTLGI